MYDVYHKMRKHGWVVANDGNVSVKLPEGNFMATSTGISKNFIIPEKLVIINDNGEVLTYNISVNFVTPSSFSQHAKFASQKSKKTPNKKTCLLRLQIR